MSTIFIAGAAGNIGTSLLAALHETDAEVVAGVHSPDKAETLSSLGLDSRAFDFNDQDSMVKAMQGCDKLFLSLPMTETMGRFGHLAVEAAKQAGITYIVRSSAYGASSDAHWRLGREHGMVDQFVEDSEIPYTILRPNSFMQNFSTFMAPIIKSGTIALPEEDAKVSYIDVRDIAACAAKILLDPTGFEDSFFALTGPEGLSMTEVAATLSKAAEQKITYTPIEEEAYIDILKKAGTPKWNIKMLISLSRIIKLGMIGNVTKAVEHITGTPARTFADFAGEHAPLWWQG